MYIIIAGHSVDERENTAVCVEKMHVSDVLGAHEKCFKSSPLSKKPPENM